MAFLNREGEYANVPRPDLILLDLNLLRKDGRQVLEEIKVNPALMTIPIVILTTSASEEDVLCWWQWAKGPKWQTTRTTLPPV
jgi:CheY-like chemotaxis protein